MKKLSRQDAIDLVVGCTILGTGGGGSLEDGLATVNDDYNLGLEYKLASPQDIMDDEYYVTTYYCGSIAPIDKDKDPYYSYRTTEESPTVLAVRALEKHLGKPIQGIVSCEYGGGSTTCALSTAARLDKMMVDGDAAGRAVPELQFSTFYINGRYISPFAVVSTIGETAVFTNVPDDERAEALVRSIACASGSLAATADHPMLGKDMSRSVILGALSAAQAVGRARREALEQEKDPIAAITGAAGGYLLFSGIISEDCAWYDEGGFTLGETKADGTDIYGNDSYKVWFKNENMLLWKNGEPWVICPDLICLLDETGYPVLNPHWQKGMKVVCLGFKAPDIWRTPKGLALLNPRFFGFDIDWKPIEEVVKP